MATQTMTRTHTQTPALNAIERYALTHAHPRSIMLNSIGALWATYFLWQQNWIAALTVVILMNVIALVSVRKTNSELIAQTTLGKLALLHLHPWNAAIQAASIVILVSGLWMHETETILGGLGLLLAGHSFGWSRVDRRFAPMI